MLSKKLPGSATPVRPHRNHRWATLFVLALCAVLAPSCGPTDPSKGGPLPIGYLDVPQPGQDVKDGFVFMGWALHQSGIRDVSVFVDGNFLVQAKTGMNRADLATAFPQFKDSVNAGWNATISTAALPPGPHEFVIQARAKSGAVREIAVRQIQVTR